MHLLFSFAHLNFWYFLKRKIYFKSQPWLRAKSFRPNSLFPRVARSRPIRAPPQPSSRARLHLRPLTRGPAPCPSARWPRHVVVFAAFFSARACAATAIVARVRASQLAPSTAPRPPRVRHDAHDHSATTPRRPRPRGRLRPRSRNRRTRPPRRPASSCTPSAYK